MALLSPLSAEIQELQALSFGTVVVRSNAQPESFRISKEGNVSFSSAYIVVAPAQRAQFRLFNLPVSSPVTISTQILQTSLKSSSPNLESFTFDSLDHFGLIVTNEFGEADVWVGGEISTNGEGSLNFGTFPLTANYQLTINF